LFHILIKLKKDHFFLAGAPLVAVTGATLEAGRSSTGGGGST